MKAVIALQEADARSPMVINLRPEGKMTLEDAVVELAPGGRIQLAVGEYHLAAPLQIKKPLRLVGAGWNQTIISGSGLKYVLKVTKAGTFAAEGITFCYEGEQGANVVDIATDEVEIHHCRFTGGYQDEEQKFGGNGVCVRDATQGKIWECQIDVNKSNGIEVADQARLTLEKNTCQGNAGNGIVYSGNTTGQVLGNVCTENEGHGIALEDNTAPELIANECRGNGMAGIAYCGNATGRAYDNICIENGFQIETDPLRKYAQREILAVIKKGLEEKSMNAKRAQEISTWVLSVFDKGTPMEQLHVAIPKVVDPEFPEMRSAVRNALRTMARYDHRAEGMPFLNDSSPVLLVPESKLR